MRLTNYAARVCRRSIAAGVLLPTISSAHVKWFCSYDVTKAPKAFSDVTSPGFFTVFGGFLLLLFLVFLLDGWVAKRWPSLEFLGAALESAPEKLVRLGTGAFFLCTWNIGLNILTPELHTQAGWIFALQFVIALCTVWRRACIVSAVGIGVLYIYGVTEYGLFHMLDYVYFLGLAIFLAFTSISNERLRQIRAPAMTGCLAFSLMWTAIEKLLYPQWAQEAMQHHGHMMMGMKFGSFIIIAAFVEFTLSFYLATGRGMLRFSAFALLVVFVSAMPEFGSLDVVGHFPLIAILGVPLISGDTALQRFWRLPRRTIVFNAAASCVLYLVTLAMFFGLYYGVQWIEYRPVSG